MKAQQIPEFPASVWNKVGEYIRGRIKADALKGIMQDGSKGHSYKTGRGNYSYSDYKKNGMKKFGRGPHKVGAGDKLKGLEGRSTNKDTSKVNLHLTGDMMRQISHKPTKDAVNIIFHQGEKVLGNKKNGYDVFDVRNQNLNGAVKFLSNHLDKNINKYASKPINLTIGK